MLPSTLENVLIRKATFQNLNFLSSAESLKYLHLVGAYALNSIDALTSCSQLALLSIDAAPHLTDISCLTSGKWNDPGSLFSCDKITFVDLLQSFSCILTI